MKQSMLAGAMALLCPLSLLGERNDLPEQTTAEDALAEDPVPDIVVPAGTHVPLVMINSISSKHSQAGDPVYLESVYPVVVDGRILIPAGSHVSGQVMSAKRPGRVNGRGKLSVRLEQMILPNGVIRSLIGRPGALDARSPDNFDRETGTVSSPGQKGEDAEEIASTTVTGASIGVLAGALGGNAAKGLGLGSAVGAAAGVTKVLLTRGPEAMLDRGTHVEMVLLEELRFDEDELHFQNPAGRPRGGYGTGPDPDRNDRNRDGRRGIGGIGRVGRLPL